MVAEVIGVSGMVISASTSTTDSRLIPLPYLTMALGTSGPWNMTPCTVCVVCLSTKKTPLPTARLVARRALSHTFLPSMSGERFLIWRYTLSVIKDEVTMGASPYRCAKASSASVTATGETETSSEGPASSLASSLFAALFSFLFSLFNSALEGPSLFFSCTTFFFSSTLGPKSSPVAFLKLTLRASSSAMRGARSSLSVGGLSVLSTLILSAVAAIARVSSSVDDIVGANEVNGSRGSIVPFED
mmetsp:Transcript_28196/g.62441  ORF Transcript_28196/g.62441 Transcript_28196/m.62441 type:complete len:245 (+) Transcript_28196:1206-1940(+)